MPDDYNLISDAAPAPTLPGTQQFWDDTLRYGEMPAAGPLNPDESFYPQGFKKTYDTLDFSMVHAPPHGNEENTVATQDDSWRGPAPSLTDISWEHFPVVGSGQSLLGMATIPQAPLSLSFKNTPAPSTLPATSWDMFPVAPTTSTGLPAPAPVPAPTPVLGTYRAMSFGPGNFPGADKATNAVLYGALADKQGNPVKMTTSDIAMSPNLLAKHNLKLGDYVDVLDAKGNVLYPRQRIADKSYVSKGKPTTDSIELWGRPEPEGGFAQIRPSS
jgi:hypothetical protein